jgi:hypothetical protein
LVDESDLFASRRRNAAIPGCASRRLFAQSQHTHPGEFLPDQLDSSVARTLHHHNLGTQSLQRPLD